MSGNPFDQFDSQMSSSTSTNPQSISGGGDNPFNQFDAKIQQPAQQAPQSSTAMDMIDVMNRNFAQVAAGGVQLGLQGASALGFDTSEAQKTLAQMQAMHERDYNAAMKNSPVAGTITDIGSKIGAAVATPGDQAILAGTGANLAVRGLQAFGLGANTGGQGYVEDGSMKQRVDNALGGGFLSAAGQGAIEGVAKGGKLLVDNKYVRAGVGKLFNTPVQEAAKSVDEGLLTTVGGATGNDTIQAAENVLSKVPYVGTKAEVQKQAGLLKDKVTNVLDDLGVAGKSKVDLGTELSNTIKSSYAAATENTNKAYKAALDIAEKQGLSVPLVETQTIAQKALGELDQLRQAGISSADVSGSGAGKLLQDIAGIQSGDIKAGLFDSLRKRVNSTISNLVKGNDTEGVLPQLQQVKRALDLDLESAGMQSQQFGKALETARKTFMNEKAPFQNTGVLDKLISGKIDTDQLLNTIIQNDRPVLTNKIVNSLSPEGQKTFSSALVNKVAQGAINDQTGVLDLQMFNRGLGKLGETITALPKTEKMKIEGIQQLLTRGDKLLHAAKGSENSIPSWLSGGTAVAAGMTGNVGNLMAAAVGSKVLSKILTSESVTRSLIKLAGGKLTTTGKDGITKSILKKIFNATVRKAAIPAAANSYNNRKQQPVPAQQTPVIENQGISKLGIPG